MTILSPDPLGLFCDLKYSNSLNIHMYIEFTLPACNGGQTALYTNSILLRSLEQWCEIHGYNYKTTVGHYKIWIEFNSNYAYTLFALTWSLARPSWRIQD
jgi:hypothetical protein